jgi:hypothetical protein
MNTFDLLQEKKIGWLMAGFAVLGSIVALAAYMNQKKHNQVEKELFDLDKEIKSLQLERLKNGQ